MIIFPFTIRFFICNSNYQINLTGPKSASKLTCDSMRSLTDSQSPTTRVFKTGKIPGTGNFWPAKNREPGKIQGKTGKTQIH